MTHVGKLDGRVLAALSPIIVRFGDRQVLTFDSVEDARGFVQFYQRSISARTQNPATIYTLDGDLWVEDKTTGSTTMISGEQHHSFGRSSQAAA